MLKEFILDLLFPKFCLKCNREGAYLCEDCFYLADIFDKQYCAFCYPPKISLNARTCSSCQKTKRLAGLFCAAPYNNYIVKNLINQFKYPPYIKEMAKPIASLIIAHFINLKTDFLLKDLILIPVPIYRKKMKKRGFNQAEEIAKELSKIFKIPLCTDVLIKIKETPAQMELNKEQRKNNIQGVFLVQKPEAIKNKIVLLIDDILTTGSTLEECARTMKEAKEVWGVVAARSLCL